MKAVAIVVALCLGMWFIGLHVTSNQGAVIWWILIIGLCLWAGHERRAEQDKRDREQALREAMGWEDDEPTEPMI